MHNFKQFFPKFCSFKRIAQFIRMLETKDVMADSTGSEKGKLLDYVTDKLLIFLVNEIFARNIDKV